MRKKSILLLLISAMATGMAWAQGASIPTTSAVKEQQAELSLLAEELPEGVKYRYPLLNGMSISANLFPIAMDLFGKDYASYEGAVTFDFHHRFFPQVGAGVGYCDQKSTDMVRYHCKMLPFFKAGMLYNFKYNDLKPNDFYGALLRFGYAYSEADVENLYYTDAFWGKIGPMNIDGLSFHSVWMEIGGFIKVQIANHFSMGWDLTFKPYLHKGKQKQGEPYFVPGYGTSRLGFAFHLYYDL